MSTLEVLVALTLLMSVMSFSLTLIVRHSRLLVAQRHYRIALDELSNQLDRLTALPGDKVPQAVNQLSLSSFATERLPAAKLTAELKPADIGQRVLLHLTWNESYEESASMAGWVLPSAASAPNSSRGAP